MKKIFSVLFLCIVTLLLATPAVQAIPEYYNPGTTIGNGNEYRLYEVSHVGNTYQYEFDIHVLPGYTGNQWTDVVDSVYIKNWGSTLANLSLVAAPDDKSYWFISQNELNAKGFTGGLFRLSRKWTFAPLVLTYAGFS